MGEGVVQWPWFFVAGGALGEAGFVVLAGEGDVAADAEGVHGFDVADGLISLDLNGGAGRD